jgi:hypothetical protein
MRKKLKVSPERHEHLKRIGTQPGQPSRNPAGRPPREEALKTRIADMSEEIVDRLKEIVMNGKNEASVVKAGETLLSYVLTKATTKHEHEHKHEMAGLDDFLLRMNQKHKAIEGHVIEATPIEQPKQAS